jgi:hypothetical protein
VNIPATPNWVRVSVVALMIVASRAQMVADAAAYRAARLPGDPQSAATASAGAAGHCGHDPVLTRGRGVAAFGFPGDDEHGQAQAGQGGGDPGNPADGLVNPEPAQREGEHELGDQERLDDRNQAIVQGKRLEQERSRQGNPAEKPQRIAEQVPDHPPA